MVDTPKRAPAARPVLPRRLLQATAAIVVLGVAAYAWATRDVRQINGRLDRIARLTSKKTGESALTGLTRVREIMACFSSNLVVDLGAPWPRAAERDGLAAAIHHARSSVETLDVTVRDRSTTVQKDRARAVTVATVEASADYRGSKDRDVRTFRIHWIKARGGWVIERVEAADSIQPPPGLRAWES